MNYMFSVTIRQSFNPSFNMNYMFSVTKRQFFNTQFNMELEKIKFGKVSEPKWVCPVESN